MDLLQAIRERRSVRKFKSEPLSDDLINTVLEAGRWAPSWTNTQCWRFVVVRDPEIKARVAGTIDNLDLPGDAARFVNPAGDALRNAPVIIVICGQTGRSGYYKGTPVTDKDDWYMFDTALAAQNMLLAAHSLGLGTVPIGVFDAAKAAEILEVPPPFKVVLLLPMGYPDEEPKAPRRKEIPEIAFPDRFQKADAAGK